MEIPSERDKKLLKFACLKNAKIFLKESEHSFKRKKYWLSTFLAITSIEECQKVELLSMLEAGFISHNKFRWYWHRHEEKLRTRQSRIRIVIDPKNPNVKPKVVLGSQREAVEIMKIREDCLYVGMLNGRITQPNDIDIAGATRFINEARLELQNSRLLDKLEKEIRKRFRKRKETKGARLDPI